MKDLRDKYEKHKIKKDKGERSLPSNISLPL